MHISVITLFPQMFEQVFSQSIIKRALNKNQVSLSYIPLRQFATDAYGSVDDRPYGGGHGMVMRVDIVDKAIEFARSTMHSTHVHTVLLDASGVPYKQKVAESLAKRDAMILVCGHYEGVDARVFSLVDECVSIGDYVLTGGEIPAMVVIDSVARLLPGVLSKEIATRDESFSADEKLLEYPQYTRPDEYKSMKVPEVLLGGNHSKIAIWRKIQAVAKTAKNRPDLTS